MSYYAITVHVRNELADMLFALGAGYQVALPDPVAVEPMPGDDMWAALPHYNPSPGKRMTVADVRIKVDHPNLTDGYHPFEVWTIPNAYTIEKRPRLIVQGCITPELLNDRRFVDIVLTMARDTLPRISGQH